MSNWAKVNLDNNVVNVEMTDEVWVANFIKDNPDSNFRYIKETVDTKSACVDGTYDEENNKFIAPKPYSNWVLNENFDWIPPITKPDGNYQWNQIANEWEEFFPPTKPYPLDGRVYRWDVELDNWVVLD
jgi:hypothetical protein